MTNIFTAIVSAFLGISQIMPSGVPGFSSDWNSLSMRCGGLGSVVKFVLKSMPKKKMAVPSFGRRSDNPRSIINKPVKKSNPIGHKLAAPASRKGMKYGNKTVKNNYVYEGNRKIGEYGGDMSDKMINSNCAGRRCGGVYYKEQLVQDKNGRFYKGLAPVFKGKKFMLPSNVGKNYRAESKKLLENIVSSGKRYSGANNYISPAEAKEILSNWEDYAVHHDVLKDCYQFVLKAEHEAARHTGGNHLWADIR